MAVPAVLLLDDGELDDVQRILEEVEAPFARVRGGAIAPGTPPPRVLLIATPRRVNAVEAQPSGRGGPRRIVVVDRDSASQRDRLRTSGFDYLVRRPVHPEALRLLVMHCLYTGEERRSEIRVPVGFEISFRSGLLPRRATLADISLGGCRLLSRYALEPGKRIKIDVPRSLGASVRLSLRGRVIRTNFDEALGSDGLYRTAVGFEKIDPDTRATLEGVLAERAKGPPSLGAEAGEEDEDASVLTAPVITEHVTTRPDDPRVERARPDSRASPSPRPPETAPPPRQASPPPAQPPAAPAPDRANAPTVEIPIDVRIDAGRQEPSDPDDRRKTPRAAYDRKVPAFGEQALRVLMGRDLSLEGMRVMPNQDIQLGDRMHLAIYGEAKEPFLVWATATRDDEGDGFMLAFDPLDPFIAAQLGKLIDRLPAVEALGDRDGANTVVTEILNR